MNEHVRKILVVDDHPIVRKGLRAILSHETDLEVCGEAESAGEALTVLGQTRPDIVIVDIALKGSDGIDLVKSIRFQDAQIPILVMSMYDESLYAERVLRAGGNGYIMKEAVNDNVIEAIRRILGGDIFVSDGIRQRILHGISGSRPDVNSSPVERLSDRELEVFRLIAEGFGTRQIADRLHLSVKTIETYRAHIKEKLNISTATALVRTAVQWMDEQQAS